MRHALANSGRFSAAAAASLGAGFAFSAPALPQGPGAADILGTEVVAEHRTKQKFLMERDAEPHPQPANKAEKKPVVPSVPRRALPAATDDSYYLGSNTRCMLGWCKIAMARAYAMALYADAAVLATARRLQASSPVYASSPVDLLTAVLDDKEGAAAAGQKGSGELSLVLMMARDIPGEHLAHGFQHSLIARLNHMQKQRAAAAATATAAAAGGTAVVTTVPAPNRTDALLTGQSAAGLSSAVPLPGVSLTAASTEGHANALSASSSSSSATHGGTGGVGVVAAAPANSPISSTDALAELNAFAAAFNGWQFGVGEEIAMVWGSDGVLRTSFQGRAVPEATLRNPALIRAMFDTYAGSAPVSVRARDTFARNLAAVSSHAVTWVPVTEAVVAPRTSGSGAAAVEAESPVQVLLGRVKALLPFSSRDEAVAEATRPAAAAAASASPSSAPSPRNLLRVEVDKDKLVEIVLQEHASRVK